MRRRVASVGRALTWFVSLTGLVLLAMPLAAAADSAANLHAGRDLFEQHCELCHGAGGQGNGPLADELKVPPPNLTEIALRRGGSFPEVEVREIIDGRRRVRAHGHSEMPIWGRAFGGPAVVDPAKAAAGRVKIDQLVEYLRSIQAVPAKDLSRR
jgi:mono/diheme cytochrome c family protein